MITLDLRQDITKDDVRNFLSSVEDDQHWKLIYHEPQTVSLVPLGTKEPLDAHIEMNSFLKGTGYVGKAAAQDEAWVDKVYSVFTAYQQPGISVNRLF